MEASAKVTVPGPLTLDHVVLRVPGLGSPSSVAMPDSVAAPGRVTFWSGPAFTVGGWFAGPATVQVNETSSVSVPSETVTCTGWLPVEPAAMVPETSPVAGSMLSPEGRPVAE